MATYGEKTMATHRFHEPVHCCFDDQGACYVMS
jgi:hypothetical protein